MKKLLLATVAGLALSVGAQAADLAAPRMPIAGAVVMPAFSWTGFYAGAHLGYGWGGTSWTFVAVPTLDPAPNPSGVFGGLQIGYNYQFNNIVLGIEADAAIASLRGSAPCTNPAFNCTVKGNFLGSIRARAGVAVDRALLYVTGGLGIGNFQYRSVDAGTGALFGTGFGTTRAGIAVGGGLEYAFTPNVTAKVEYMYYHFGSFQAPAGALGGVATDLRQNVHTVKIGLNYLFSTGHGAVVARY